MHLDTPDRLLSMMNLGPVTGGFALPKSGRILHIDHVNDETPLSRRQRLHEVIFETETRGGKAFDVVLIIAIIASVVVVMLDSVAAIHEKYSSVLVALEWTFTIVFTIEYVVRLLTVTRPASYAFSFFGIIDLLAVMPTYIGLLVPGSRYLLTIRVLRLLRIFRVLKLVQYVAEASYLHQALHASRRKISVFLLAVLTLVVVLGSLMYVIEGERHGFTSIPISIYWAVVTLTTVGYGNLSPQTPIGQLLAACIMIMGYSIIAVPTGIVTAEMTAVLRLNDEACPECGSQGHDHDAKHCKFCGSEL